jgi:hypothetical protein
VNALQHLNSLRDREAAQQAAEAAQLAAQQAAEEALISAAEAQQLQALLEASDMEAAGDRSAAERDYISARLFYTIARERFLAMGDMDAVRRLDEKQVSVTAALAEIDALRISAALYIEEGNRLFDDGNFEGARIRYILARNIFMRLQDELALVAVLEMIDMSDTQIREAAARALALAEAQRQAEEYDENDYYEQDDTGTGYGISDYTDNETDANGNTPNAGGAQ